MTKVTPTSAKSAPRQKHLIPTCKRCGSIRVLRDAWAGWDDENQNWTLAEVFDHAFCPDCDGVAHIEWLDEVPTHTSRIRMLNDTFRSTGIGNGRVFITAGVRAVGDNFPALARKAVAAFDAFDADNDPHGEHNIGSLELEGEKLCFKLDYYAPDLEHSSEDPAIESQTTRVLTIMLADEY